MKNRVVVTGMSACTPCGIGYKEFEENVIAGTSGIRKVDAFTIPSEYSQIAGQLNDFYSETEFRIDRAKSQSKMYRERQLAIGEFCINEALKMSGLSKGSRKNCPRIDLCMATAIGSMVTMEYAFIQNNFCKSFAGDDKYRYFSFRESAKQLVKMFNLSGVDIVLPTGCVGGCDAVAYALNAIRLGKSECMIVGAVEAPITPLVVTAFGQIKATSTRECLPSEASRPFDSERDGFVLGEGGGILILESEKSALARGATIYAEIKGSGSVNNCYHMTDISTDGYKISESCRLALEDADLDRKDIDYINAHGSSTKQNDIAEANAFNIIFGERTSKIPVTSIKSQTGHALSAASAIEMVSVIQTINSHKIPPTLNVVNQDPLCNINVVKGKYLQHPVKNVLKTSSGFSGIHTAVVIGKYEEIL